MLDAAPAAERIQPGRVSRSIANAAVSPGSCGRRGCRELWLPIACKFRCREGVRIRVNPPPGKDRLSASASAASMHHQIVSVDVITAMFRTCPSCEDPAYGWGRIASSDVGRVSLASIAWSSPGPRLWECPGTRRLGNLDRTWQALYSKFIWMERWMCPLAVFQSMLRSNGAKLVRFSPGSTAWLLTG